MSAGTTAPGHTAGHGQVVKRSQQMGVLLLIAADAAFVLSLIFAYLYLRGLNTDGGWIPKGARTLGPANAWIIAAIIVVSAAAYGWGEVRSRAGGIGSLRSLVAGTGAALILLLVDLAAQIWRMSTMNLRLSDDSYDSYASSVMVMSGAHIFHLVITLVLGVAIFNRARRGLAGDVDRWHARMVGYWWYWVAFSAVLVALTSTFTTI